jgi:hypothetical protein
MRDSEALPVDPGALLRSKQGRVLLVSAALIGLLVSVGGIMSSSLHGASK